MGDEIAASPLAGADIRTLSDASFDDGTLTLNFTPATGDGAVTSITAGTPYIIKWERADDYKNDDAHNIVSPEFSGVTLNNAMNDKTCDLGGGKSIIFSGTYAGYTFTTDGKSILFLSVGNTLNYPQSGATIGAQHRLHPQGYIPERQHPRRRVCCLASGAASLHHPHEAYREINKPTALSLWNFCVPLQSDFNFAV